MTVQAPSPVAVAAVEALGAVAAQPDLDTALTAVVEQGARLGGAPRAALALLDAHGEVTGFVPAEADGLPDPDLLVVPVRVDGRDHALLHLVGAPDGTPEGTGLDARREALVRAFADAAGHVLTHLCAEVRSERRRRWLEAATDVCHALLEAPRHLTPGQVARTARSASGASAAAVVALPRSGPPVVREYDGPAGLVDDLALVEAVIAAFAAEPAVEHHVVAVPLDERLAEPSALVLVLPPDADVTQERELLASYATQAGLALDRAQAIRERQDVALVAERERIGRELHDTVVQRLFAVGLGLQALRELPTDLVVEGVDAAVDTLDEVIREIRATVLELRG